MKKVYVLLILAVIAIIGWDVYYFFDVFNQQIAFQERVIRKQISRAEQEINSTTVDFENDILYLLDPVDFNHLFDESTKSVEVIRKTGLFFSKYHALINSIKVFNTRGQAVSISKDSLNHFKTEFYKTSAIILPDEQFKVNFNSGKALYNVPVQRNDTIFGKVIVNVELHHFLKNVLENYQYHRKIKHWIIDNNQNIIYQNRQDKLAPQTKSTISQWNKDSISIFQKKFRVNGERQLMLTATTPVEIMNSRISMAFAMPLNHIRESVMQKTLYTAGITLIILLLVILAYMHFFRQLQRKNKALENSGYRFNSVINGLEDRIFITDSKNRKLLFANEAIKNCEHFNAIVNTVKKGKDLQKRQEIKIHEHWYEIRNVKTRWVDGSEAYLHALSDITYRKDSDEKIAQSEETFRQIFQLLPVGIFILDENEIITEMNQHAHEIFNITTRDQYIGKPLHEALTLTPYNSKAETSWDDKNKFTMEHKDKGKLVVYRRRIPIIYDKTQAYLESFIDITSIEEKRQGEALANKAKSEFIANLSHEIRTPLSGVTGMADALLNANIHEEEKEYAEIIKKSADLLQTIINDILDLSKIESGRMQLEEIPFSLRDEVEHAVQGFKIKAREKGLKLFTHFQENISDSFIGDPFRLKQVLTNLISNAIKFTQEGEIKISVEKVRKRMGLNILLFTVEDSGIGIPLSKINKIFESFSQADASTTRKYGGTGLGTTISKQLVEMMGGEIWVESPSSLKISEEAPGSKFIFTCELYSDEKISKNLDFSAIEKPSDLKVLVVDNEPQNNKTLNDTLDLFEAQVSFASDKKDAEHQIRRNFTQSSRFHIVFIEDRENFNGFEIMSHFFHSGLSDWCIFVLMSSHDKTGNYVKTKHLHADHYIIKPFQPSELYALFLENFSNLQLDSTLRKDEINKRQLSILVAEDNNINQRVIRTLFKSLGYETEIANNGDEVLNKVRNNHYDLIFMDVLMPNKDGIQTTTELRNQGYNMPVIALTGGITEQDMQAAEQAGMDDYLSKPIKLTNLKNILLKWIQTLGE